MDDSRKETSEQKVKRLIGFSRKEKIGLGLLLLFIVISPILFSQFSTIYSFENTGPIGDTIGGITAPFVNLLAAYLIYKSFTAQIKANAQQREDHDEQMSHLNKEHRFNYINNLFTLIKEDCLNNGYIDKNTSHLMFVKESISTIVNSKDYKRYNELNLIEELETNDKREFILLRKEIKRGFKSVDSRIAEPFRKIEGHAQNILDLINEIGQSELELSIVSFYRNQIQNLIYDLDFHLYYNDEFIETVENSVILKGSVNMSRYIKIKHIIEKIKKSRFSLIKSDSPKFPFPIQ